MVHAFPSTTKQKTELIMADASVPLEKKTKEQDPAYHAVLQDFKKYCETTIANYQEEENKDLNDGLYNVLRPKYNLNTNGANTATLGNELTLLCSELALWIYTPNDTAIPKPVAFKYGVDDGFFNWNYKKIVETKQTQISQWAFLQFSGEPKNAYLVFKGTDPDKIFDIMADTAVIPMPIWCREDAQNTNSKMEKKQKQRLSQELSRSDLKHIVNDEEHIDADDHEWQFCGHSGIYATLMRDFHRIWKMINCRIATFDNLYVVGHSLGGGLAVLFGLESIINKFIPSNKAINIITFGSPSVISYENDFNSLSRHAKKILYELHNICHCFVNRFDPVPRVPAIEWMTTVIPYALKKIVAQQFKQKMNLPAFLVPLLKFGVKSGVSKFVQYVEKYLDLLRSYHPFGTYYFYAGKHCDVPFVTKNQTVIEQLLGFIPPHKIVTSDGQELRVCHYSTKMNAHRFCLSDVTELTSGDVEVKLNIADLWTEGRNKVNAEGVVYDNAALYVSVESDNEAVREEYKAKKLSEEGWIMLVSNHLMEQYIDIFKVNMQHKKSKYPLLAPNNVADNNHFGVADHVENKSKEKELTAAMYTTASLLKSTSKKLWSRAKDKYQKEMDQYQRKGKEIETGKGIDTNNKNISEPNVVNPTAQILHQPQYEYYQSQPQYVAAPYSYNYAKAPQPGLQRQTVYVQQPTNLANGQQIGNTQYRIAQHPTHYVVYPQRTQPHQPQPNQQSLYPSLAKK